MRTRTALILLTLLTAAIYAPVLGYGHVFDDVARSDAIRPISALWTDIRHATWVGGRPIPGIVNDGRPIWFQHAVSFTLHLTVGFLLWTWLAGRMSDLARLTALALFWLHPMQTETVAYVNAQPESWIALGTLLVLIGCGRPRLDVKALALIGGGFFLAAESKEIGIWAVVPIAGLTILLGRWRRRGQWALVGVMAVWSANAIWRMAQSADYTYTGPVQWAAGESCLALRKAWDLAVPLGFHQQAYASCDLVAPGLTALDLGVVILAVIGVVVLWRRAERPVATWWALAGAWSVLWLFPRWVGPVDVRGFGYLSDHHFYLPMLLLCPAVAVSLEALVQLRVRRVIVAT